MTNKIVPLYDERDNYNPKGRDIDPRFAAGWNAAIDAINDRMAIERLRSADVDVWTIAANDIERLHAAMDGEARADPNKYCRTCVAPNGRARVYPCKTLKIVRKALEPTTNFRTNTSGPFDPAQTD